MTAVDPGDVLAELPDALWPSLLQAVRTAANRLGRSQLPSVLQPYAGFTPSKLRRPRARAAVAVALGADARLRDAVGEVIGSPLLDRARDGSVHELVAGFGLADTAAVLVATARWEDLQTLAAETLATRAQRPQPAPAAAASADAGGAKAQLSALRRERDAATRARGAAERRAAQLESELEDHRRQIEQLRAERDAAVARADDERARLRDRLARLQRRASEADAQARADRARVTWLAGELGQLSASLLDAASPVAVTPHVATPGVAEVSDAPDAPAASSARVPRGVRAATPGRPCVLPPGTTPEQPAAMLALLEVVGIEVVIDGYNVTKDLRGVPTAGLADQRAWLVRIAAAVAAGRDVRVTVVFDGDRERTVSASAARVVRCVFTANGETADDRIVDLVRGLDPSAPVVVVTSDREVRDAVEGLRGNVVASGVFLRAVG